MLYKHSYFVLTLVFITLGLLPVILYIYIFIFSFVLFLSLSSTNMVIIRSDQTYDLAVTLTMTPDLQKTS